MTCGHVRRRLWSFGRPAVVTNAAVAVLLLMTASAEAGTVQDAVTGIVVRSDAGPASQAIAIQQMHPGSRHEAVLFLDGSRASTVGKASVDVTNIRDLENGCNRPEHNSLDVTCGPEHDAGELSQFLEVGLASGIERPAVGGGRSCLLDSASMRGQALSTVRGLVVERPAAAADGDVMCLVATFHHVVKGPIDNLTQTDSVLFDVELRFEGDDPSDGGGSVPGVTDVGGDSTDRGLPRTVVPSAVVPGGGTLGLGLAATGAPVLVLLGFALGLVGTGVLVRTLARGDAT